MLLATLLLSPALASDPAGAAVNPLYPDTYLYLDVPGGTHFDWPTRPSGGSSGGSSGSSGSSSSTAAENIFKKGKIWGWTYQPYVSPGGGVQINTSNGDSATSIMAGVDVGVKYSRKKWAGDLYAGASYSTGDGLNGYDVHLGDQTGRREKYWGVAGGLEAGYSGYLYANGDTALKPAVSVGVPIDVVVGPTSVYGFAGIMPMYVADKSRQVDWSQAAKSGGIGFGSEFEWHLGLAAKLSWFTGTIGFEQHTTVAGVQNIPTLTVGVGG